MRDVIKRALSDYQRGVIRDARNELGGVCHCGELCIRFSDGSMMPFDTYYTEDVLRQGVWVIGGKGRDLYRLTRVVDSSDILDKNKQIKRK